MNVNSRRLVNLNLTKINAKELDFAGSSSAIVYISIISRLVHGSILQSFVFFVSSAWWWCPFSFPFPFINWFSFCRSEVRCCVQASSRREMSFLTKKLRQRSKAGTILVLNHIQMSTIFAIQLCECQQILLRQQHIKMHKVKVELEPLNYIHSNLLVQFTQKRTNK